MKFLPEASLRACNTLRLEARARYLCEALSTEDIGRGLVFAREKKMPLLLLGEGSNVVLPPVFDGLVMRIRNQGEELIESSAQRIVVRVAAGVPWHAFVLDCHRRGWHGLENLALIPGTVGAAPMQNIGAYGVEISRFVQEVYVLDRRSGEPVTLSREDCGFAYRHSVFKDAQRERLAISAVTFELPLGQPPCIDYPALRAELQGCADPGPDEVLAAVIRIRTRRLPDPARLPNAGSFFKNPIIDAAPFEVLRAREPELVFWPYQGRFKLAAAWLVDQAGWKGFRKHEVGVHAEQALVLVNYGCADAARLLELAQQIRASVLARFGVKLEIEPAVY